LARHVVLVAFSLAGTMGCAPPDEVDPDAAPPPGPYPVSVDPAGGARGGVIDQVRRTA
jgi:hypothetical protein